MVDIQRQCDDLLVQVRADPRVIEMFGRNPNLESGLEEMVRQLVADGASQWNIVPAVLKCLDGQRKIRVFISYKSVQEEAARKLYKILNNFGPHQFEIFCAAKSIQQGRMWEDEIYPALLNAHWLIVLYPEREHDLTWVVFEAGNFHGVRLPGDRLFCIHRPENLPFQGIRKFQTTPAQVDQIFGLLRMLLKEPNPVPGRHAVNPEVDEDLLKEEVAKLTQLLEPNVEEWKDYGSCVTVQLDRDAFLAGAMSLRDAPIAPGCRQASLVFGKDEKPGVPFGQLIDRIDVDGNNDWVEDLSAIIRDILNDHTPTNLSSCFKSPSGRMYRPYLAAVSIRNAKLRAFKILFVESFTGKSQADLALQAYQTAARLGFRLKWELLEAYKQVQFKEDVRQVEQLLKGIEAEAKQDGIMSKDLLIDAYEGKDREKVDQLYEEWDRIRFADEASIRVAFEKQDATLLRRRLVDLARLNKQYMQLAASRAPSLMEAYWK